MSANDKVFITISGPGGSGKTTLARLIADTLKKAGFDGVVNLDPDANDRGEGLFPVEADRVRRFAEGRRVTVTTASTTRQALQRSEFALRQPREKPAEGSRVLNPCCEIPVTQLQEDTVFRGGDEPCGPGCPVGKK